MAKNKKKKEKKGGVYTTPVTKNSRTFAVAFFVAVSAVTSMFVAPNPRTKLFTVTDSPAAISTVSVFDFPTKTIFPSRAIVHETPVASPVPMFLITALTPNPPAIESTTIIGSFWDSVMVAVVVSVVTV